MIKELKKHKAVEYIKEIKELLNDEDFWLDNIELRKEELKDIIDYIDKLELEHKKMSKRFRNSKGIDKDKYLLELMRIINYYCPSNDLCYDNENLHVEMDDLILELLENLGYEDIVKIYKEKQEYFWYA